MTENITYEVTSGSKLVVVTYHPDTGDVYEYLFRLPDINKVPGDTRAVYGLVACLCRQLAEASKREITFNMQPIPNTQMIQWARSQTHAGSVFGDWDKVVWRDGPLFQKIFRP